MTRRQLVHRLLPVRDGERGFTLIETVIAMTIILGSLVTLAYTATIGFTYGDLARQKVAATGVANQIMEEIRGLSYDTLTKGMLATDLASDTTNIKACGGPTVYRFLSCTPDTTRPGSGEKIVSSASAANPTIPLVPHQGTITKNNVAYSWSTYVTNDCPVIDATLGCAAINPYRVTVIVTWTGGRAAPNKLVEVQSLFYSPTGCRSTATHPFATPCQPFFFGEATVPQGQLTITAVNNGIQGTDFQSATLFTGKVEANAQHEQLSQVQGGYAPVGVSITDGSGTRTAGGVSETTTAADADPGSSSVSSYASKTLTSPVTSTTVSSPQSGNTHMDLTLPAGDTARTDSTTSAGGTNVCPPPTDTAQTDLLPCGGARHQQGGNLTAILTMNGFANALGTSTIAQVAVASNNPNKVFENRVQNPTTGSMCTPSATMDGCLEQTATRRFGTISLGGLPSSMTAPSGWTGSFLSITGYQDQVVAAVGKQSTSTVVPAPTATISAGTVSYYNGLGYTNITPVTSATLNALNRSMTLTQTVSPGQTVTLQIGTVTDGMAAASTSVSPTAGAVSLTEASALSTPPKVKLYYRVSLNGATLVDLQISVDLRQMEVRGVYGPAPAQGS